jgi:cysteine synthase A
MAYEVNARNKIYNDITEVIGGTPLVKLNRIALQENCAATILAKLEFLNPLSSIKDRTALAMINAAERDEELVHGGTIVEATSGNMGISLAFITAMRGYKLIVTMPENMSIERRKLLEFFGAKVILTPAADGMYGAVKKAEEIEDSTADAIILKQFENRFNWEMHYHTTADEIWQDTKGQVDALVAGVGTGATLQGIAKALKERNEELEAFAVEPASSSVLTGGKVRPHQIQGIGPNFIPPILDMKMIDDTIDIGDDEAMEFTKRLARNEGILAGISSGAAVAAAIQIGKQPSMRDKNIVVLLPDTGERYLSTALFQKEEETKPETQRKAEAAESSAKEKKEQRQKEKPEKSEEEAKPHREASKEDEKTRT